MESSGSRLILMSCRGTILALYIIAKPPLCVSKATQFSLYCHLGWHPETLLFLPKRKSKTTKMTFLGKFPASISKVLTDLKFRAFSVTFGRRCETERKQSQGKTWLSQVLVTRARRVHHVCDCVCLLEKGVSCISNPHLHSGVTVLLRPVLNACL